MSNPDGTAHQIDLVKVIPDHARREQLLQWGSDYLAEGTEDATLRAASLALEMRDYFWRWYRNLGQRPRPFQLRLSAIAFVVACHRRRQAAMQRENEHALH